MSVASRRRLAPWLLVAVSLWATAQEPSPPAEEFRVEVIVFRHLDQSRNTPEQAPPAFGPVSDLPPPPDRDRPTPEFLLLDPSPVKVPRNLARDQLQLEPVLARLERIDAYQPLAHFGWQQAATSRAEARDFWLAPALGEQAGLSGKLKIYKERYLHLAMALAFDAGDGAPTVIEESRRLRGERLQYFDNPKFGVIAAVTRVEADADAGAAAAQPAGAAP